MKKRVLDISFFEFILAAELYIQGIMLSLEHGLGINILVTPEPSFTENLFFIIPMQMFIILLISVVPIIFVGIGFSEIKDSIRGDGDVYYLSLPFYLPIYCIAWFLRGVKNWIKLFKRPFRYN